jgi:beta-galactosidase
MSCRRFVPSVALRVLLGTLSVSLCLSSAAQGKRSAGVRVTQDFDVGWKYAWGADLHAESADFNDAAWKSINLPHDAAIAGPVDKANPSGPGGGFFPSGVVWYRKSFTLPRPIQHHRAYVVFEGVMANSEVWLNGAKLGERPNGTVSFFYDLTSKLHAGSNEIVVRCDTSKQPASRWYEGLGIYRPVHLVMTDEVHISPWSTFVTAPTVSADAADVKVAADVQNDSLKDSKVSVQVTLLDPDGKQVEREQSPVTEIKANSVGSFLVPMHVKQPQRWNLESPSLYRAEVRVIANATTTVLDDEVQPFGIREFHFDPATGFWLNGRNFKVYGAAVHIDGGAVGIAVPTAVWERRLNELRELGVNAIRTAHNPPSPEFLDLCDRMGFLVMDEMFDCWEVGKNPYDYHLDFDKWSLIDLQDTVRRDRNHPSIILWSAGNEIHDTPKADVAKKILRGLVDTFHKNDPTRPVTQALFRPNASHDYDDGLADMLDVIGQNYREQEILAAHAAKPTRRIIGTENTHDRNQWVAMRDHPEYSGQFLWTGVDYLGEAGQWPIIDAPFGLIDRIGVPHARGYERESWWVKTPNVHIARRIAADDPTAVDPGYEPVPLRFQQTLYLDWSPRGMAKDGAQRTETVEVYSNCEETELFLNGISLGKQPIHADASPLIWKVPFAAGTVKAVSYNQGKAVATDELRTAGKASRILLSAQRRSVADSSQDAVVISAKVVDGSGTVVADAANLIHFQVEGPGAIVGVDNGSNVDHDSFAGTQRRAFEGYAAAFVQATAAAGTIHVKATADGLLSGDISLTITPEKPVPASPAF